MPLQFGKIMPFFTLSFGKRCRIFGFYGRKYSPNLLRSFTMMLHAWDKVCFRCNPSQRVILGKQEEKPQ